MPVVTGLTAARPTVGDLLLPGSHDARYWLGPAGQGEEAARHADAFDRRRMQGEK